MQLPRLLGQLLRSSRQQHAAACFAQEDEVDGEGDEAKDGLDPANKKRWRGVSARRRRMVGRSSPRVEGELDSPEHPRIPKLLADPSVEARTDGLAREDEETASARTRMRQSGRARETARRAELFRQTNL